ncbi:DNA-binding MarR family transcriptional regulator [Mycetocola sp. BIGb0189]|uniref:MarR family winged helix-turn-helix transcriptional regulator n=1 Tax=Mycetocola sp. BIGb0189 TaxID=2940604 RepID=UPI0021671A46|nr:MarR family transcriptional regulator [Mycetocola sp. BIGb0189]MCS4277276.1 DNA-binding MarR family transcriptional regulator [Mycetocola sp. BIGb0189]
MTVDTPTRIPADNARASERDSAAEAVRRAAADTSKHEVPAASDAATLPAPHEPLCAPVTVINSSDPEFNAAVADLEHTLIGLFARVRTTIRERAELLRPGLQPGAYKALGTIISHGSLQAGELAELLGSDRSTTSRLIRQLVEHDLIVRTPDVHDGRVINLSATDAAIAGIQELREAGRSRLYENMRDWETEDIARLSHMLRELTGLV